MKKLCCEQQVEECEAIKAMLEQEGIPCIIRHEATASLFGTGPGLEWPEVWVVNDEQFEEAWAILNTPPDLSETSEDAGEEPDKPEA